ncbi:monovalent cation/H+ antiporter complex subunit F [Haloferula sp.]|uniref:monovalent cation/H+ antiporter complex subunit F n=1 Tax=Haloferula sp. TaxID=2497595 RepID=UPI003C719FB0
MILTAATTVLAIAVGICLLRVLYAKSDADRVISIDVLSFQLLGLGVLMAFHDERSLALQFVFALSILGFLSTLILSRLIRDS